MLNKPFAHVGRFHFDNLKFVDRFENNRFVEVVNALPRSIAETTIKSPCSPILDGDNVAGLVPSNARFVTLPNFQFGHAFNPSFLCGR